MKKTFSLHTEPHVADVGGKELQFLPEVMGDQFMDAYSGLIEAQRAASGIDLEDLATVDSNKLRGAARAMRAFLAELMLPESAGLFTRLNVVKDGKVLESFPDRVDAERFADEVEGGGAVVVDAFPLPDRILVQLLEWVVELYGGGADERPPTSSTGSATASRRGGRRGMGVPSSRA
ncbi:hypothetical protein ACH5AL_15260 [Actinacidiphila glaucinigra]|uniref:hypothetical protein n=1 Tax=Actinacidiphila glaucinigra TaxID=235986 RepID=UPI00379A550E